MCSGGIFGIGEGWRDRVDLAFALKELNVSSIPLNFLNPRPNTPFEKYKLLSPLECLRIIALFRFILPEHEIVVCGGREANLRELQSLMYYAGASGNMTGDYLTTKGRGKELDIRLIEDLEFTRKN